MIQAAYLYDLLWNDYILDELRTDFGGLLHIIAVWQSNLRIEGQAFASRT